MKKIFYKIVTHWCAYPFQDEIAEKYVEFYRKTSRKGSKRYEKIEGLRFNTDTSIKEKEEYLKTQLGEKVTVQKLKF